MSNRWASVQQQDELFPMDQGNNIPPPHRLSALYGRSTSSPSQPSVPPSAAASTAVLPAGAATSSAPYRDDPFRTPQQASTPAPEQDLQDPHGENPFYMPSAQFGANSPRGYANVDGQQPYSAWNEKPKSGRSKWIVISSIIGIIVIVGVAVGVGVGVSQSKSSSNKSASGSGSGSSGSGSGSSSSGDPSNFEKDPALKQSFYGIAYTPEGSQLPDCGNNIDQVITDIQLLSQLTTRIRLYGADCNQSSLVMDAIQQTKVNMTVYLGNYNVPNDAGAAYDRQRDELQTAMEAFGTSNIGGITVGNEFMLNWLTDNGGGSDPNSAIGNTGAELLITNITDTRNWLKSNGWDSIPVGTSDAGAYFNNEVLAAVDYGMANVHPWFADTTIQDAAPWTFEFFQDTDVAAANAVSNKPAMYIAETGWPTNSSTAAAESNGAADASVANLQIFLDNFVCQANANNTNYFFFEYFDEVWKDVQFGGVEGYWGLFYANRTLKSGITIPDCS